MNTVLLKLMMSPGLAHHPVPLSRVQGAGRPVLIMLAAINSQSDLKFSRSDKTYYERSPMQFF